MVSSSESTLAALIPEAEALVGPFRREHDPSAALGMPAHVTVLYPFKPPEELIPSVIDRIRLVLSKVSPFDVSLENARQFPGVLYLAPNPDTPFKDLTRSIFEAFPENPPYGGAYPEIIPHLTVAHRLTDDQPLEQIVAKFLCALAQAPPIRTRVSEVALVDNEQGSWTVREAFRLGSG